MFLCKKSYNFICILSEEEAVRKGELPQESLDKFKETCNDKAHTKEMFEGLKKVMQEVTVFLKVIYYFR